ncbi:uncharacterized protein MYCFIDRAFT_198870 [Pseudocercospora fijiensis CIRAD86]|uniref:Uncharacterized protein n=1 Tax=Pseudocercospora fijiensis (strain CIRAD86) TaxID=383855 RepID=M2YMK0_PSEFD|nr:uncharacterized protein MYCFIDRAFT_198870 [Pseudocercospora fijiensis CIRAD86]EME78975.1 hypothetical protein MYCFIDRAFT_198870 [Pseudocercospora fijiensis CIRAD86]
MATRTRPQTKSSSKQVAVQSNQQQSGQKKTLKTHVVEQLTPFNVGVFCACSTLVGGALSIYMTNYWFGKKATEKANQDKKDLEEHRNGCLSDSQDSHSSDSRARSYRSRSSSSGSYDRDYRDYYDSGRRDYDRRRDYDYEEREAHSRRR